MSGEIVCDKSMIFILAPMLQYLFSKYNVFDNRWRRTLA